MDRERIVETRPCNAKMLQVQYKLVEVHNHTLIKRGNKYTILGKTDHMRQVQRLVLELLDIQVEGHCGETPEVVRTTTALLPLALYTHYLRNISGYSWSRDVIDALQTTKSRSTSLFSYYKQDIEDMNQTKRKDSGVPETIRAES